MTIHTASVGGNMNQQNLAPFSVWSSVQKYVTGDLVVYSTAIWQASTNSLGNTPTSTSTAWTSVLSGGGGGGTPGGSDTQFQYNSSGTFEGAAELTRIPAGVNPSYVNLTGVGGSLGSFGSQVTLLAALDDSNTGKPTLFLYSTAGTAVNFVMASTFTDVQTWTGVDFIAQAAGFSINGSLNGDPTNTEFSMTFGLINLGAGLHNLHLAPAFGSVFGASVAQGADTVAIGISTTPEITVGSSSVSMKAPRVTLPNLPTTNPAVLGALYVGAANALFWSTGP